MNIEIPGDYSSVVEKLVSGGRFRNAGEVVAEGLRLVSLREELCEDVQAGLDQLDAGHRIEPGQIYEEARKRIAAMEDQQAG